jgi:ATP-dependent Clp protease ATP-binding subunit ClpA
MPTIETELNVTPRVERILHAAAQEAQALGESFIGAEHLLLGIIAEGESIPAGVMAWLGVSERIRSELLHIITSETYKRSSNEAYYKDNSWATYIATSTATRFFLTRRVGRCESKRRLTARPSTGPRTTRTGCQECCWATPGPHCSN